MNTRSSPPLTYLVAKKTTCHCILHCYEKRGKKQYRAISTAKTTASQSPFINLIITHLETQASFFTLHTVKEMLLKGL